MDEGRSLSREDVLELIDRTRLDWESAIRDHSPDLRAGYEAALGGFLDGAGTTAPPAYVAAELGLTSEEWTAVHRLLFAGTCMSAWWRMVGNGKERDKVMHAACLMLAGLGMEVDDSGTRFIEMEQRWRRVFQEAGTPGRGCMLGPLAWLLQLLP